MQIKFTIFGHPEAQGSTRAFIPKGWNRPIITSASKKQKPWRQEVSRAAMQAMQNVGKIGRKPGAPKSSPLLPVEVTFTFYLVRPQSLPEKYVHLTKKPDWDKLARSVCDSLTGICFVDDSQITDAIVRKRYGQPERVEIIVATIDS